MRGEESDGTDPDIERLERNSTEFLELFRVGRNELSVMVDSSGDISGDFLMTHVTTLYDSALSDEGTVAVVLATRHPDFPEHVQVWRGVLDYIDDNGVNTMIVLLDGREVPLYALEAYKIAPG